MYTSLKNYCDNLVQEFDSIPKERKELLEKISVYIRSKLSQKKRANLVYICTHNSRRSHFGQIWAHVASNYYKIPDVYTYSGGTEATAFNANAINALRRAGFLIRPMNTEENTLYQVWQGDAIPPSVCFSKIYNHPGNPQSEFAAILTCSDAEENCPFIPGVELRIGTTYDDPKVFDNTAEQDAMYDKRCRQIALETLCVFSRI